MKIVRLAENVMNSRKVITVPLESYLVLNMKEEDTQLLLLENFIDAH